MTTSTPRIDLNRSPPSGTRGMTLTEVMVAIGLSCLLLTAVLSAFLFIGRSSLQMAAYSDLEVESRQALELFAEDVRMAANIIWKDAQCITLILPAQNGAPYLVTYGYDTEEDSPTYQCFYRQTGLPDSDVPRVALIRSLDPDFAFERYKLDQPGVLERIARNDLETKQIQVVMRSSRIVPHSPAASHAVVSATYVLRNKRSGP